MNKTFAGPDDNLPEGAFPGNAPGSEDSNGENLTGQLLVAAPSLAEGFFGQSVIYLCAHSPEAGAMGLIINRRLPQPGLDELFARLGIEPNPPERRIPVCLGGPVEHSRGFVLHSTDWAGEGSLGVNGAATLTASLDVLRELARGNGPRKAVMALGHASWAPGQLESEIARDGSWFIAPASEEIVFGSDHTGKWRRALASIDVDPMRLSSVTGEA